jgi:hypothetical protein
MTLYFMFLLFLVHPKKIHIPSYRHQDPPHCYITVPNSMAKLSYLVFSVSLFVLTDNPLFQIMVFCSAVFKMNNISEEYPSSTFRV